MSLVLLLARYFVHSNLPIPSRLLSPCVTQRRHKTTRRPPKAAPVMSADNEKRENYWGAILEFLDPPEFVSKNRTKSAGSSHKGRVDNFDPITSEPSQPIKRGSQKQKRPRVKSSPISDLAFDIQPDGLFTNVLSKPDKATGVNYQAIIDTATGTKYGTKDIIDKSLPTEDIISKVETVATGKEKVIEVSHQTETETKVSETETEEIPETGTEKIETRTDTEISDSEIPETETKPSEIGTKTVETGTEISQTETKIPETGTEALENGTETMPEEEEPKFLEVLRESNWMKMGDPRKKCVRGIVINQTGKQVYVDYGHKFYGVFKIPDKMEPSQFQTGTKLLVTIKELELTQHFMGEDEMYSLLESRIEFVSLST